jgi:hypothetical protein
MGGKRRKVRGFLAKTALSFPFLGPEQRRGEAALGRPAGGDCR